MIQQIETILSDINSLHENEYIKNETQADRFNVFDILQITSNEVRLHSRFLAELLNPKGSHGQGTIFLDKFLELTGCRNVFTDTRCVRVLVEYHIGTKTEIGGGKLDLLLVDDKRCAVIIENKIYAGDQENQLLRYHNYAQQLKAEVGNYSLLYLTLHGNEATEWSTGSGTLTKSDYTPISYAFHIRSWLEVCVDLTERKPKLHIGLQHYLQLIDQLTGIHMDQQLQNQIAQRIIEDTTAFNAAISVSAAITTAKQMLLRDFGLRLKDSLETTSTVKVEMSDSFGMKYHGMEIFHGESGDPLNRRPHIRLSFLGDVDYCYIEIHPGLNNGTPVPKIDWKQKQYAIQLDGRFPKPGAKIQNTEKYWQGEWVCYYYKMDNVFDALIEKSSLLFHDVLEDLMFLYDHFVKMEIGVYSAIDTTQVP